MGNTPKEGWGGRPWEAPPLFYPDNYPDPQVCGCDSVSSCLTPWAVVSMLLLDLLRVHTNCRFLLDLFTEDTLFQQPANLSGLLKLSFPGWMGALGVHSSCEAKSPVQAEITADQTRSQSPCTWSGMLGGWGWGMLHREGSLGAHLCHASAVSLLLGKAGVGDELGEGGWAWSLWVLRDSFAKDL